MKIQVNNIKELIEKKSEIIQQKRWEIKTMPSAFVLPRVGRKSTENINSDVLQVKAIISTTGWMDSHDDVHIKGCFTKTVKEGSPLHVQEHKSQEFSKIISSGNDLKAFIQDVNLKDLGYGIDAEIEAYTFESTVRKERNEYMHNQYSKGWVTNHSIGMQYVKLYLAVHPDADADADEEKENWNKYYSQIINKERANELGYFFAVTELKAFEGSAVPIGSNILTPVQNIEAVNDTSKNEAALSTSQIKSIFQTLKFS